MGFISRLRLVRSLNGHLHKGRKWPSSDPSYKILNCVLSGFVLIMMGFYGTCIFSGYTLYVPYETKQALTR